MTELQFWRSYGSILSMWLPVWYWREEISMLIGTGTLASQVTLERRDFDINCTATFRAIWHAFFYHEVVPMLEMPQYGLPGHLGHFLLTFWTLLISYISRSCYLKKLRHLSGTSWTRHTSLACMFKINIYFYLYMTGYILVETTSKILCCIKSC